MAEFAQSVFPKTPPWLSESVQRANRLLIEAFKYGHKKGDEPNRRVKELTAAGDKGPLTEAQMQENPESAMMALGMDFAVS
ncbi:hypothetical protein VQ056_21455 [Paenibacillus sp. JTLBN-2024]